MELNLPKQTQLSSRDFEDKDLSSSLSRHISLIFKHIGFLKTEKFSDFGYYLNYEDVLFTYHHWYRILSHSRSPNFLQKMCTTKLTREESSDSSEDVNDLDDNDKSQSNNKNWLSSSVYILSAFNYRKELNQLEGVYEQRPWINGIYTINQENIENPTVENIIFQCVFSNGVQLLKKVMYSKNSFLEKYRTTYMDDINDKYQII